MRTLLNLNILMLVACCAIPVALPACQPVNPSPTTQPVGDPIVVSAEKATEGAFIAVDAFLQVDEALGRTGPQHAAAETLRKEFPPAFRAARQATKDYASHKIDYSTLEGKLSAVESAARIARASMAK